MLTFACNLNSDFRYGVNVCRNEYHYAGLLCQFGARGRSLNPALRSKCRLAPIASANEWSSFS